MSKRVLMFGWEYAPYYTGGLGVVTRSIIENLHKLGIDVVFVLPKLPINIQEKYAEIINAADIKIEDSEYTVLAKLGIDSFLNPYYSSTKKLFKALLNEEIISSEMYGYDLFKEIDIYSQKAALISKNYDHEIIHTHDWMTCKAGIEAKKISGKPMILHVHATEFDRTGGSPNQEIYNIEREGMEKSDKIIAVSELTKKKIIENYGIPESKIVVVHNAIDQYPHIEKFPTKTTKTDKIVLFLGRMTLQKGPKYLLEAAQKVLQHRRKVKFVFVGHGDMLKDAIEMSIKLGIQDKVMFTGFMNHKEIDKVYQLADVYVMPSISEPFGITVLEAIKNGTPVIISKQSGVAEIVKNALKVDFWDVDELANQLLALLTYDPLAKQLSRNAYSDLKEVSWAKQSKLIVDVYNQM